MGFQQLEIETWGQDTLPTVYVRVKRQADKTFYDASDGTFKPEAQCRQPFVSLSPSSSPNEKNRVVANIDINPANFPDGDYTIYYHSDTTSGVYFGCVDTSIYKGSTRKTNPTDVAARVLDATVASHGSLGSMGDWMADVTNRLQAIQSKLGI